MAYLSIVWGGLTSSTVEAQPRQTVETQLFQLTPTAGTGFTVDRPEVARHLTYSVGLGVNGASGIFVRTDDEAVVPWRVDAEALAALGLFEWFEFGVAVPLVIGRSTEDPFATDIVNETYVRAGDIRLSAKVPLLRGDFALSAKGIFTIPSGDGDRFLGQGYWTFMPSLVTAYRVGILSLGADVGWRFRQKSALGAFEQDDELHVAVAANIQVHRSTAIIAEGQLRAGLGGRTLDADEVPLEIDGGLRFTLAQGLTLDVGAGTGVVAGYGAPLIRGFAALRWASEREPCEAGPEDFDGYLDGDFCADPDNDGDGIEDDEDDCPNDAEDIDQFLDRDGCPDTDNDADGVIDDLDRCPVESEDRDGFQDEDGCPEPDNDEDGLADGIDQCPMEPEDRDAYQDEDGCPEPGPEEATITVTDSRILISERIYFDFDTETIRSVSLPLLDQVAEVIGRLPATRRIRVDGYSDSEGDAEYNLDLSYRRARAVVEYLSSQGVPRNRLEYRGYGEVNPVAPNDSPEGRALNRRVEMKVLKRKEVETIQDIIVLRNRDRIGSRVVDYNDAKIRYQQFSSEDTLIIRTYRVDAIYFSDGTIKVFRHNENQKKGFAEWWEENVKVFKESEAFHKGNFVIGLGTGMSNIGVGYREYQINIPPAFIMAELPVGYNIGVGVSAGAMHWQNPEDEAFRYSYYAVSSRVAYHFNFGKKWDVYAGVALTGRRVTKEYEGISIYRQEIDPGLLLGARYYLNNTFGFFAEIGDESVANPRAGLTLKFGK